MRLLIANFDGELEMARTATPGPHPSLPAHVKRRLAQISSELAVFGADEIALEAASCSPNPGDEILAWAETESVAALRADCGPSNRTDGGTDWIDSLWASNPSAEATTACHDRRFTLALALERRTVLPKTCLVDSVRLLTQRLPSVISESADGAWIAKAPFGASGRERVYRWGAQFPDDIETRLLRLLERYGELILEPMMPRLADVGVAGVVGETGIKTFPIHRLICDDAGVFRSIELATPEIPASMLSAVRAAAEAAGEALHARGHRGAYGIDGFVYRTPSGDAAIQPMCEINARLTFGHVAHAKHGSVLTG